MRTPKTGNANSAPSLQPLLSVAEAAKVLNVSERKVWELLSCDIFPKVRVGRSVRLDPLDIRSWIDKQRNQRRRA